MIGRTSPGPATAAYLAGGLSRAAEGRDVARGRGPVRWEGYGMEGPGR